MVLRHWMTNSSFHETRLENLDFEEAVSKLVKNLRSSGFGVLGDISIDGVLKEKTGKQIRPIRVIEVCKPPFALAAIEKDRDLAQVMPCRITLFAEGSGTRISLYRPTVAMKLVGSNVEELASMVEKELVLAIEGLGESNKGFTR